MDPPKQFNRSTYFTVAGERRQMEIPMPHSLLGSKPGEVLNRHVSGLYTSFFLLVSCCCTLGSHVREAYTVYGVSIGSLALRAEHDMKFQIDV